ncbi:MAG: methionyl-tRNA formyltransferase [Bacilli bacterium]|nr:methionyl-tRNA formyltransferase [Bacilli bacterium]
MLKEIKVVFMGTPEFSVNILKSLIENTSVIGVVTQPDKMVGRKKELVYPRIKEVALENNILVFQPRNIKEEYQNILDLNPDMIITCAYGQIIPKEILDYPKYGCINVHASLLPKLRGGAPIHHAIIDGYKETGITIMYMDTHMDSGDIISQEKIEILETDTYQTLHDKLSILGSSLLIKTLPSILNNTNQRIKQDINEVTFGYNITRDEELIDFKKTMDEVYNKIRGLTQTPGSYFYLNNKIVKVYESFKVSDSTYQDKQLGEIVKVDKKGIYIKVKDGLIKITEIMMEGKKRMPVASFLNGNKENLVGLIANLGEFNEK